MEYKDKAKLEVLAIIQELRQGFVSRSRKRHLKSKLEKIKKKYGYVEENR